MTEPSEFKFECKEHENCKRYFKSEKRLKEHLRRYGGKPYPKNLARQYVPNLPENHSTIIDSTNIQRNPKNSKIFKKSNQSSKPLKKRKKDSEEEEEIRDEYQPPFQQFYQHLYPGNFANPQEMYRNFKAFSNDSNSSSNPPQNY